MEQFPKLSSHKIRVFATNEENEFAELNYLANGRNLEFLKAFNLSKNRKIPVNPNVLFMNLKTGIETSSNNLNLITEENNKILAGDWFAIRKQHRWIGATAYIYLMAKNQTKSIELDITARPLLQKGLVKRQRLKIYINNKFVKEINYESTRNDKITIDLANKFINEPLIIKFDMPDAIVPATIRESNDTRHLSLLLTQLILNRY